MSDQKTRVSIQDHVDNVHTKNGRIYHARQALKNARSELDAYTSLATAKAERTAELTQAVTDAQAKVDEAERTWEQAKADLKAARERADLLRAQVAATADEAAKAVLQAELDGLLAGSSPKARNGEVRSSKAGDPDKVNEVLTAFVQSAHWTPTMKRSLVDWLDGQFGFHQSAPFTAEELALEAAHAEVDKLPAGVQALVRATMKPRPSRPETAAPPTWGTLPVKAATETASAPVKTVAEITAEHKVDRESLAEQVKSALADSKAKKQEANGKAK